MPVEAPTFHREPATRRRSDGVTRPASAHARHAAHRRVLPNRPEQIQDHVCTDACQALAHTRRRSEKSGI